VLDEIDWENRVGKKKFEYDKRGPKGGNPKRFNTSGA